jgi:HAD superfamily hydrolase (TIGR01490 family)
MRQLLGRLPSPGRPDGDPGGSDTGDGDGTTGDGIPGDGIPGDGIPGDGRAPGLRRRLTRAARKSQATLAGEASAAAARVEHRPPVPDPAAGAFFDVDNTLMRGASIYHFARGLAARKMFGPRDLARLAWGQLAFRLRGTENSDHIDAARESALAFVAGHKVSDIAALGEEIYDDTMADRIWAGARELTQRHLEAGQRVWLVTATPVELANILSRRLGLTGALGTVAETADGAYTGRLVGSLLHGEAKAAAIRALAEREGLDLARCSAYSDSINDLPMLSLVGHPNVVNPDADLRALARSGNWPIYDFRSGRRATMIALPVAAGVGAVAGGMAAGIALRRRRAVG